MFNTKSALLHSPLPIHFPLASLNSINKVLDKLKRAKKPVLLIGSQALYLPSHNPNYTPSSLQDAAKWLNIPTYLSGMARGLLGAESVNGLRHNRSFALKNADVVILVGVVCDFRLDYGRSIREDMLSVSFHKDIAGQWFEWQQQLKSMDLKRDEEINTQGNIELEKGRLNPIKLFQHVESFLDDNSILVADGGDFVGTASYVLHPRSPLSWLDPGPFGTLGVGGGFALGAALAKPEAQVWVIFGDGACGYSLVEFDTYVRHKVPVIAVVGNDAAWQQILRGQVDVFKDEVASVLAYTDYHQVVTGFGAAGLKIETEKDIVSQLTKAKEYAKQGLPVLVNCIIGKTDFRKDSMAF